MKLRLDTDWLFRLVFEYPLTDEKPMLIDASSSEVLMKKCSKCKQSKTYESFHNSIKHVDGKDRYCSDCRRASKVKSRYGVSVEEYDAIIQGGCEVCGAKESLRLDHSHENGRVRGCLCHGCNVALGLLGEDINRIRRLAAYAALHAHIDSENDTSKLDDTGR